MEYIVHSFRHKSQACSDIQMVAYKIRSVGDILAKKGCQPIMISFYFLNITKITASRKYYNNNGNVVESFH